MGGRECWMRKGRDSLELFGDVSMNVGTMHRPVDAKKENVEADSDSRSTCSGGRADWVAFVPLAGPAAWTPVPQSGT